MKTEICEYCKKQFTGGGWLRPYGRNGARICFECGTSPENEAVTEQMFTARLNHAEIEGMGVSVLDGGSPRPDSGEFAELLDIMEKQESDESRNT